jgi:hypothetical protein
MKQANTESLMGFVTIQPIDSRLRRDIESAPSPLSFGMPEWFVSTSHDHFRTLYVGAFLVVDPTSYAADVQLPEATSSLVGRCLTVCNYSASTNAITIFPHGNDEIDADDSFIISTAMQTN